MVHLFCIEQYGAGRSSSERERERERAVRRTHALAWGAARDDVDVARQRHAAQAAPLVDQLAERLCPSRHRGQVGVRSHPLALSGPVAITMGEGVEGVEGVEGRGGGEEERGGGCGINERGCGSEGVGSEGGSDVRGEQIRRGGEDGWMERCTHAYMHTQTHQHTYIYMNACMHTRRRVRTHAPTCGDACTHARTQPTNAAAARAPALRIKLLHHALEPALAALQLRLELPLGRPRDHAVAFITHLQVAHDHLGGLRATHPAAAAAAAALYWAVGRSDCYVDVSAVMLTGWMDGWVDACSIDWLLGWLVDDRMVGWILSQLVGLLGGQLLGGFAQLLTAGRRAVDGELRAQLGKDLGQHEELVDARAVHLSMYSSSTCSTPVNAQQQQQNNEALGAKALTGKGTH